MSEAGAADMTLGALAVAIGGDLAPLQAKLAEARSIVEAFDRDIANGSAGLLQFTERTKGAGDALVQQTQKATDTGRATGEAAAKTKDLADANDRLARSSKETSAALETEAQKTERLSSVIDRAVARANQRQTLAARTGPLPGIESAGIPANYRADQAVVDAMMGTTAGKIPGEALAGASAAGAAGSAAVAKGAAKGLKEEAVAMEELGGKTKITSTAMREFITIPREIASGNWSRVPGSISILAQQMGVLTAQTLPFIAGFGLAAIAVGAFGIAAVQGSKEANRLSNELQLSGNRAGETAGAMRQAAIEIGEATRTSRAANLALIEDLTKSNDFSRAQIEKLVLAAQQLSRATGESAEDITKDFAKMAQNPLKYAEAFQHAHLDIISPAQMAHLRELDRRGEKEQEIAELIELVVNGIAKNTADNLSYMTKLWQNFTTNIKNWWNDLQHLFQTAPLEERIGALTLKIQALDKARANPRSITPGHTLFDGISTAFGGRTVEQVNDDRYKALVNERSQLQMQLNAQNRVTDARARDAETTDRQNAAITRVNTTYAHGIDRNRIYRESVVALNNTLADAARVSRDLPLNDILSAAAKSPDAGTRDLAAGYQQEVQRLKKQNMPEQFKADAKAAREAAAEAKRLEREAEALEKRRQQAITTAREEGDALADALPLYRDYSISIDEVNKRKAIAAALAHVKLTAESAEGRELAAAIGRQFDYGEAIKHETQAREILDQLGDRAESLKLEAELTGKNGWQLAFEEAKLRALAQAKKDHIPINDEFMASIEKGARAVADAAVAVDEGKFFDKIEKSIDAVITETETMGRSAKTSDYATIRIRLMSEAKAAHIKMTDKNIAKIEEEARTLARAESLRGKAQRMKEYAPEFDEVKGSDYHALDQALGGRFKRDDDLIQLKRKLDQQKRVLEKYREDSEMGEKEYQARLSEIDRQGAVERLKIMRETANMQLDAATQIADSLASIAKDSFGEQSKAYRALFDISKAFSIAKAALAMYDDVSQAMSKGFPQNIPLIAQAFAQGALIISNIRSIALTFADGGLVRGPGTGRSDSIPAWLSDGEYVVNSAATAAWRPVLDAINGGHAPALPSMPGTEGGRLMKVTVHNHAPGVDFEARYVSHDEVEIIATRVTHREAPKAVASDMAQPNSRTSKAVTSHFDARRRRT